MVKTITVKKRNKQDATLINVDALKKRVKLLETRARRSETAIAVAFSLLRLVAVAMTAQAKKGSPARKALSAVKRAKAPAIIVTAR